MSLWAETVFVVVFCAVFLGAGIVGLMVFVRWWKGKL